MIIETIFDSIFGSTHKNSKYYLGKLKENTKDSNDPEACFGPKSYRNNIIGFMSTFGCIYEERFK